MFEQNIDLLRMLSERFNTGGDKPECRVWVKRKDGKGGDATPFFLLPNVMEVTIDRRYNMSADELKVTIANPSGKFSPDYSPDKRYTNVEGLNKSGFSHLLEQFNEIYVEMGYGNELRKMFTGQIDNVTINDQRQTLQLTCRNLYRKLLKPIDPESKKVVLYKDIAAHLIIHDLLNKAGLDRDMYLIPTINGLEYSISHAEFGIGYTVLQAIYGWD